MAFGALIGAGLNFIGGLKRDSDEQKAQARARQDQWNYHELARTRFLGDRANDRAYAARLLVGDRKYLAQQDAKQSAAYKKDRYLLQQMADRRAEMATASRGIDFEKLRDDAVRAGYNPMTALGMAHAYSTEVGYGVNGTPYQTAQGGAGLAGGGAGPSASPSGGGISIAGAGYSAGSNPALAAGSFVSEAMQRGADSYFNTPPVADPLADALRDAFASDQMAQQVREADVSRPFGYSLTEVEPFQPSLSVGVPPLRRDTSSTLKPMPSPTDELVSPSKNAIKVFGREFAPLSGSSDVSAVEERYGDIPSGIFGAGALLYDLGANARVAYEKARGRKVEKIDGRYYVRKADVSPSGPVIPARVVDYAHSGITGSKMITGGRSLPDRASSWADVFYQ